ncbi:MAG: hypothetical protein JOZ72_16730 [Alphaproteobacteria bacterium]|nr:hypothetical protein [Alphaproteobacteria bacterium]
MELLRRLKTPFALALAAGALLLTAASPASAGKNMKVLHSFCSLTGCIDGKAPTGSLFMDEAHNIYGTAETGGAHGGGTVYELANNSDTGVYRFRTLYNFCNVVNCTDGSNPVRNKLIMDEAGQIYGTTQNGGTAGNGTVFMLVPNAGHTRYTQRVIHSFCEQFSGCEDGAQPVGGLTYKGAATGAAYDGVSPLFGVTTLGGRRHVGVVFSLTPNSDQSHWTHRVLYFFCAIGKDCTDGQTPNENVFVDSHGNVIGTTAAGGHNGAGVVYRLVPTARGHWAESVLHDFCNDENCADGKTPVAGVIGDAAGNVYGSTAEGGTVADACPDGCGLVYKVTPAGNTTVMHAFCAQDSCADGIAPSGLMIDSIGNIFGTTNGGGKGGHGTIYELNASFVVLYDIKCKNAKGCIKGVTSTGSMAEHPDGRLFGSLLEGGRNPDVNQGVVFQFSPTGS